MLNGVSHFGVFVFVLADCASLNGDKSFKFDLIVNKRFSFWLIERDLRVECHLGGLKGHR